MAAKEMIGDGGGRKYANSQFPDQNRQDAISREILLFIGKPIGRSIMISSQQGVDCAE